MQNLKQHLFDYTKQARTVNPYVTSNVTWDRVCEWYFMSKKLHDALNEALPKEEMRCGKTHQFTIKMLSITNPASCAT